MNFLGLANHNVMGFSAAMVDSLNYAVCMNISAGN